MKSHFIDKPQAAVDHVKGTSQTKLQNHEEAGADPVGAYPAFFHGMGYAVGAVGSCE